MKWNRAVLAGIGLLGVAAIFVLGGCTSTSTRTDLTVVTVNDGSTYYSDLINEADTAKIFIPVDQVTVKFGAQPHDGSAPLAPGSAFTDVVVTGYSVTYNNGVFSPISGGMNVVVSSGGTADAAITISNPSEKAALLGSLTSTVTSTATITFTGYVRTTDSYGDRVSATAYLTVQVDNFGDSDVNQ
ncbi:MAG: hypothetical protein HY568_01655 [Candidatus Latescibacteria bacterium]|nr:hypothetical protein [Candidatus Latescibacterota bacterium]